MYYNEFLNKIENNNIESSYLFIGDEEYLMNKAFKELKNTYIEPSFEAINYGKLEGKNTYLEDLISACETLPFMSEKRIVLLKDVNEFMDNVDKKEYDSLYKYLDDLGDFICLIMMDNTGSLRKNTKLYREFNKKKQVVDFSKLSGPDLNGWINNILKDNNKRINPSNLNYFVQKSSYNSRNVDVSLFELENELSKLIDFSKSDEITKDDIDQVLIDSLDTNIFQLLDTLARLDVQGALNLFNEMYMGNEPVPRISYMITRQIRLIFSYKLYNDKGYSPSMIQKKLGIGNYEFGKVRSQSNNFSIDKLSRIMNDLLDMDIKMKTTSSDEKLLMEMFIVKMCS